MGAGATATNATASTPLPDGTTVPADAIESPASVPVRGVIAPAVPDGSADAVVAGASSNGIPAPALSAYQRGAQIIDAADKSCNIAWELIAAIGRVESDHGRYNGNTLTADAVSKPGIYGIALNGKNGTQAIQDTDGGQLDKDTVFDRAVGPMQFIPSTWQVVKVDADGDAERNPQDMDDAALATAVYLCSGKDNLSARAGQEAAVFRYNHSKDYVNLVLRIMEAYSEGEYTAVPSGTYGGTSFSPDYSSAIDRSYEVAKERKAQQRATQDRGNGGGVSTGNGGSTGGTGNGGGGGETTTGADGVPSTGVPSTGSPSTGSHGGDAPAPDSPVRKLTNGLKGVTGGSGGGSTPSPDPVKTLLTETQAKIECAKSYDAVTQAQDFLSCVATRS